jgi:hypothetical protein
MLSDDVDPGKTLNLTTPAEIKTQVIIENTVNQGNALYPTTESSQSIMLAE